MGGAEDVATDYADAGGTRLYCEVAGNGRPLVLLHGGLVDLRVWDPQVETFAREYRVVRYDLAGYGRSDPPAPPYSHRDQLRALLDHLGLGRAHVLGLSMSGTIALDFALAYPERVSALVHAAGGLSGYEPERFTDEEKRLFDSEEAAFERGDVAEAVEVSLRLWTDGPRRAPGTAAPAVRGRVREMTRGVYARPESPRETPLLPPAVGRLGEIGAPALVIHGDEDLAHIAEVGELVAAGIPGARREVIAGTAHHLNLERPEEFDRVVLGFLRSVPV